jgi:hypothetical protein
MTAMKGDIYDVYVPTLVPQMLCIGGTAILIGVHNDSPMRHALD